MAVPPELLAMIRAQVHRSCARAAEKYGQEWGRIPVPTSEELDIALQWYDLALRIKPTFEIQARVFAAEVRTGRLAFDELPTRHFREEVGRLMGMSAEKPVSQEVLVSQHSEESTDLAWL